MQLIRIIRVFGGLLFLLLSSCSIHENKVGCCDPLSLNYDPDATIDSGECIYSDALYYMNPDSVSASDKDGNLIVINECKQPLHLYVNGIRTKLIPSYTNNYLVNIPKKADKCELSIYKVSETDDVTNPELNEAFKKWVVVLPTDNEPENRLKWVVSDFATSEGNGTIRFTYPSQQGDFKHSYNTDVYLQSKSGAYMVSLSPGSGYAAKIDYGVYKFYYKYWYSTGEDASSAKVAGWLESSYLTLNAAHENLNIAIPGFNAVPANAAMLKIVNKRTDAINVYWGHTLIEDLVYGYENTDGLSSLSPMHETLYYLDAGENNLVAWDFSGSQLENIGNVTLINNWQAKIVLGLDREEVFCQNKTSETIYLGTDSYTGIALNANEGRFIQLEKGTNLSAFNIDSTYFKNVQLQAGNLTIE